MLSLSLPLIHLHRGAKMSGVARHGGETEVADKVSWHHARNRELDTCCAKEVRCVGPSVDTRGYRESATSLCRRCPGASRRGIVAVEEEAVLGLDTVPAWQPTFDRIRDLDLKEEESDSHRRKERCGVRGGGSGDPGRLGGAWLGRLDQSPVPISHCCGFCCCFGDAIAETALPTPDFAFPYQTSYTLHFTHSSRRKLVSDDAWRRNEIAVRVDFVTRRHPDTTHETGNSWMLTLSSRRDALHDLSDFGADCHKHAGRLPSLGLAPISVSTA